MYRNKKIINYFPIIARIKRNDYYDYINTHRSPNKLIINPITYDIKDINNTYDVNKNRYLCHYKKPSINFWRLWYQDNRDRILIERKSYYLLNKDKWKAYYQINRDRCDRNRRINYHKNKEVFNEKRRERYKNDIEYRDKVNNRHKNYYENNKEKIREYKREWIKQKRLKKNDYLFYNPIKDV